MVTDRLVTRADQVAERDPETGLMLGTEPLDLGPAEAKVAVLFVHGFIGGTNNFGELPYTIADLGCRVRAMRLPGHGTSPRDFENTTPDELYDAVVNEYEALRDEHDTVLLIGHSMGGALSALVAANHDVDGLVLGAPYFGVTSHWYYILTPEQWSTLTKPFIHWLYKGDLFLQVNDRSAVSEIASYDWVAQSSVETLVEVGTRARAPEVLEQITCPVLMLHSRRDNAASPERAATAFEAIGSDHKEIVWLTEPNHIVFWDYEKELVEQRIVDFVTEFMATHNAL